MASFLKNHVSEGYFGQKHCEVNSENVQYEAQAKSKKKGKTRASKTFKITENQRTCDSFSLEDFETWSYFTLSEQFQNFDRQLKERNFVSVEFQNDTSILIFYAEKIPKRENEELEIIFEEQQEKCLDTSFLRRLFMCHL